jgi:hypothetical protein
MKSANEVKSITGTSRKAELAIAKVETSLGGDLGSNQFSICKTESYPYQPMALADFSAASSKASSGLVVP